MQKVITLSGLPGSGKSEWARRYVVQNSNTKIVSLDNIREMLFGVYDYRQDSEALVRTIALGNITTVLSFGCDCIIDDSLLTSTRQDREVLVNILRTKGRQVLGRLEIIGVSFIVDPNICLVRRSENSKGLSPERWTKTFTELLCKWEPLLTNENFDDLWGVEC